LAGNIGFVAAALFVGIATTFPMISEAVMREAVTFKPEFYNRWMPVLGLPIFLLMGVTPLLGWRQTKRAGLVKGMTIPGLIGVATGLAHLLIGTHFGMPAFVTPEHAPPGAANAALTAFTTIAPLLTSSLAAFNIAVVVQELVRGTSARSRAVGMPWPRAFAQLVLRSRRRYGGYIAHLGVALMFIGFLGQAWGTSGEASLTRGQSHTLGDYSLRFDQTRVQIDPGKQMSFADLTITDPRGHTLATLSPAKFLFRTHPNQPTTEIAVLHTLRDDLYVVLGGISQDGQRITIQAYVNPLVSWIWVGLLVIIMGGGIAMWPSLSFGGVRAAVRFASLLVGTALAALLLAAWLHTRFVQPRPSQRQAALRLEPVAVLTPEASR
jgi:cytochrome c-type biogenesis protein CcmF